MLGKFRAKRNLYFIFSAKKSFPRHKREADIDRCYKQIQQFKKDRILLAT